MKRNVKLTIEKLKELRYELKLTQEQFAKRIGKSVSTVQSIECGRLAISAKFEIEVKLFLEHSEYFDLINKYLLKQKVPYEFKSTLVNVTKHTVL